MTNKHFDWIIATCLICLSVAAVGMTIFMITLAAKW